MKHENGKKYVGKNYKYAYRFPLYLVLPMVNKNRGTKGSCIDDSVYKEM